MCKCDSILIVDVNNVLIVDSIIDFSEKMKESYLLLESVKESHIFRLDDRESD